jgi:hypothetical protein
MVNRPDPIVVLCWTGAVLLGALFVGLIVALIIALTSPDPRLACEQQGGQYVQTGVAYLLVGKVMVPMPTHECIA